MSGVNTEMAASPPRPVSPRGAWDDMASPRRAPVVSEGWMAMHRAASDLEPEKEESASPLLLLRHGFLRLACARLAALTPGGGDAVGAMLTDTAHDTRVESFFTDPLRSRLYVWLPPDGRRGAQQVGATTVAALAAAARLLKGLECSADPPEQYSAAICLFKPAGEAVTEENVTRVVSTVDLGGGSGGGGGETAAGMAATLAQLSRLSRHLYYPVGADQLCPTKDARAAAEPPREQQRQPAAGAAAADGAKENEAWSEGWSVSAMDSQMGEAAKRQVDADFSRFMADLDVAAARSTSDHAVCLPVPLSETTDKAVDAKTLGDRVRMIERAVMLWTAQIRDVLDSGDSVAADDDRGQPVIRLSSNQLLGPRVELEHWSVRRLRLENISSQLSGRQVEVCMQVLRAVQSTVYNDFARLRQQVSPTTITTAFSFPGDF